MFAYELHHCARWDGSGQGRTLGEALVSEGLEGHFVQEVLGEPPEPWECLPVSPLRAHIPAARAVWDESDYPHAAWFFGAGQMPRWTGYAHGYRFVGRYLEGHRDALASTLVHADAERFWTCFDMV